MISHGTSVLLIVELYFMSILVQILEDASRAHAAADAHRHHTELAIAALHLIDELHSQL